MGVHNFQFTFVGDQNGNPLANGTTVTVKVEGESVDAQGDLDFSLPDTQSPGWTQFKFVVYDIEDSLCFYPGIDKIEASGPNGSGLLTISG